MPIQLTCLNPACGHVLSVPEKYAGQQGTCPHCGTSVTIPRSVPVQAPGAQRGTGEPPLELAEPELVEEPELIGPSAATRTGGERRTDTRRLGPAPIQDSGRKGGRGTSFFTRLAFAGGIFALLVLGLIPEMDWVYVRDPEHSLDDFFRRPGVLVNPSDKIPSKARDTEDRHDPEMPRGPNIFDTLSLVMGGVESHSAPYSSWEGWKVTRRHTFSRWVPSSSSPRCWSPA
jgi:hypothetical protein